MTVQEREMTVAQAAVMGQDEDSRSGQTKFTFLEENHQWTLGYGLIVSVQEREPPKKMVSLLSYDTEWMKYCRWRKLQGARTEWWQEPVAVLDSCFSFGQQFQFLNCWCSEESYELV